MTGQSWTVHIDTTQVAPSERVDLIRAAVAEAVVPLELEHRQGQDRPVHLQLDSAPLGPLSVQSMRMSPIAARRTQRQARDDAPPSLFVIAKRAGSSAVVQDGREAVIGAGDLVLVRSTQPSLVLSDEPNAQDTLQIPLAQLGLPEHVLRPTLAVRLGPGHPLAAAVSGYLDSVVTLVRVDPQEAELLARVAVDLVRGLITTVRDARRPARTPAAMDPALAADLVAHQRAHWPGQRLAAARSGHLSADALAALLDGRAVDLSDRSP